MERENYYEEFLALLGVQHEDIQREIPLKMPLAVQHEDIQREILLKMPLISLSIIREDYFKDLYLVRSMARPRLLIAFCPSSLLNQNERFLFHSIDQEQNLLLSSPQQQGNQTSVSSDLSYNNTSAPIRGLVCIYSYHHAAIFNPGTTKVLPLPALKVLGIPDDVLYGFRSCSIGYDKDNNIFKVLCILSCLNDEHLGFKTHQVITVRSGEESWRTIECKHRRWRHITNVLCLGGFLYYGALDSTQDNNSFLVSFNVTSEELTFTELPNGVRIVYDTNLVSYNGQVALAIETVKENGELDICSRDEIAREWKLERIVIHGWKETAPCCPLHLHKLHGTIGTGELVFARDTILFEGTVHSVMYYDTFTHNLREFKIKAEGVEGNPYYNLQTFLNHVDSL